MVKKIAVINDLSGFGRCSLTAAIPVISAMGVQACPLPTAVLSAQTGFPDYYCDNCPQYIPAFTEKWKKMNARFDGIYTGFATDPAQIDAMTGFVDCFKDDHTQVLVDPILGDDGAAYKFYSGELCDAFRDLARRATIITPNLTELCLLTGTEFDSLDHGNWERLQEQIASLCSDLYDRHHLTTLVTGILHAGGDGHDDAQIKLHDGTFEYSSVSGSTGVTESIVSRGNADRIATGIFSKGSWSVEDAPLLPASYSGTGDLFASVMIAGIVRGGDAVRTVRLAQEFLGAAIRASIKSNVYPPEGTDFEPYLPMLRDTYS
ncbi:MAG: bifunctional hydroxymethylpyrimidine kinase/phosphomethylpyrimidine kinase [Lachnospiraceae bacterium]|nr:bifunctional hydroxymethylpyrimidine kinase/phosphomethylpyrimidine kinase [Lachnospiraceae bacterium]